MQGQHILPVPPVNDDGTISKSVLNQMWELLRNIQGVSDGDSVEYDIDAVYFSSPDSDVVQEVDETNFLFLASGLTRIEDTGVFTNTYTAEFIYNNDMDIVAEDADLFILDQVDDDYGVIENQEILCLYDDTNDQYVGISFMPFQLFSDNPTVVENEDFFDVGNSWQYADNINKITSPFPDTRFFDANQGSSDGVYYIQEITTTGNVTTINLVEDT